ncbi:MAG TPA: methyl-accepting chemotaxis protein [Bryobacteraceae bacterium]|nr:methyl-accepting chemotaxis protein [Bryobacteraceae bacterium]
MSAAYSQAMKAFTDAGGKNSQAADGMVKGMDRASTDLLDQVAQILTTRSTSVMQDLQDSMARERRILTGVMVFSFSMAGFLSWITIGGMNARLHRAVAALTEGADQIASAAGQVSSSSQSLAQGTSEQAASLEQTSASSQEMASMTGRNAENSRQSAELMGVVDGHVAEGNRMLDQMVASMKEIGASSDKISRIIKVIDEIAFQTNILALNAAVEAARAGDAGMGFAVVADEVRNLAQRSAKAAKDTTGLIEESIGRSTEGRAKLEQVAAAIRAITESAAKVKTLVDEVHISSDEQAKGIDQISKAIAQMEQVTQKAAAGAEESASASQELNAQSETLREIVQDLRAMVG